MLDVTVRRPIAPDDIDAIRTLAAAAEASDRSATVRRLRLARPRAPDPGCRWSSSPSRTAKPVGALHLAPPENQGESGLIGAIVVEPRHRGGEVEQALLETARRRREGRGLSHPPLGLRCRRHRRPIHGRHRGSDASASCTRCACGCPSRWIERWPHGCRGARLSPRRRRGDVALGEQPGLRRRPRPARMDARHAATRARKRRGSIRPASCSHGAATPSPASAGPRFIPRRHRTNPRRSARSTSSASTPTIRGSDSAARSSPVASGHSTSGVPAWGCCSSTPRTLRRSVSTRSSASVSPASTVPTSGTRDDEPLRHRPRRRSASCSLEWGEPRYRGDQIWEALYASTAPLEDARLSPARCANGSARHSRSRSLRSSTRRAPTA